MSSAIERGETLAAAPQAGAALRAARERVGWSLEDLAPALRIRLQYLEALEAGRIGELPGNAYVQGPDLSLNDVACASAGNCEVVGSYDSSSS